MKKPFVLLWLLGILALCLPMSYMANAKANTYNKQFMLLVPVTALVAFVLLGLLCWLAYYIMKKYGVKNPAKITLVVFTVLVAGTTLVMAPEGLKKMRERRAYLESSEKREEQIRLCIADGKKRLMSAMEGETENPEKTLENYCTCMYDKMEADPEVSRLMYDKSVSNSDFNDNKKVVNIRVECLQESFLK